MTNARVLQIGGGLLLLAALIMGVTLGLERLFAPAPAQPAAARAGGTPPPAVAHITATLFYVTPDGQALTGVRREVPLADGPVAQGRQILGSQTEPAPEGYLSAVPAGTTVRGFYLTPEGDAFVDLSADVAKGHPGGSGAELLTVYTIVNAVTANLPAVRRVQILVDGKEVDTLAGHVDLRRPFDKDTSLVAAPATK